MIGWYQVEEMLLAEVKRHREFDRSRPWSAEHPTGHWYGPAKIADMRASIRADGILEPLLMEYEPDSRMAILGEGNHRLWLAEELGLATVPVRGVRASPGWIARRCKEHHRVPGEPRLLPEPGHGYFPSTFSPSRVFPAAYFPASQLAAVS